MQEVARFPDWGKMQFHEYPPRPWPELLAEAPESARGLVSQLIRYESGERVSASEVSSCAPEGGAPINAAVGLEASLLRIVSPEATQLHEGCLRIRPNQRTGIPG